MKTRREIKNHYVKMLEQLQFSHEEAGKVFDNFITVLDMILRDSVGKYEYDTYENYDGESLCFDKQLLDMLHVVISAYYPDGLHAKWDEMRKKIR